MHEANNRQYIFLYLEKKFQLINALKVLKLHITKTWPFFSEPTI